MPTVSIDLCTTKAFGEDDAEVQVVIIVVDYSIRRVHKLMQLDVVPGRKKIKSN